MNDENLPNVDFEKEDDIKNYIEKNFKDYVKKYFSMDV